MRECKNPECQGDHTCSLCFHMDEFGSELRMELYLERYGGE